VRRYVIPGIFVLSGAAGLIFEVVWARQLVLVFGNTTQAVSAILTGFFGGMAIGSWIGGKAADRSSHPLRLYAALELTLAIIVILTPLTFGLIHEAYRAAFSSLESQRSILSLLRFALALAALAPATVLMGATLPTLTRYLAREASALGTAFTRLYVANTMGAVFGAAAAGFILIELLGLSGALLVGAACSATAGIIAILFDFLSPKGTAVNAESTAGIESVSGKNRTLALGFAFVSGFTALSYQTLWTRLIASGTGSSTYVFTTILTIFLVGLAMGGVEYKRVRARLTDVPGAIAISQVTLAFIALTGILAMSVLDPFPGAFVWKALVVVLPATFIMGFSFPAASALIAGNSGDVGTRSGSLLAINTLGAIVGTFIVPFLLIPLVGSPVVLALTASVNALTGIVIATRGKFRSTAKRGVVLTALAFIPALAVMIGRGTLVDPNVARLRRAGATLYRSAEDEIAAVQSGEADGRKQVWVTGFSMTFLTVDAKLMPLLPLMLRPDSKSVLTIAFGMGSSFRSALIAGLRSDAVELVPSVPLMFEDFYPDAQRFTSSDNGRIVIADGRNFVELTDRKYDIIVVDPPPPLQSSGVSIISSREFYKASMERLNPSGVMMQWVPWGQSMEDFKTHVRTFHSVFPNVIIASGPGGNGFYMLGSRDPVTFEEANVRSILSRRNVAQDISSAYDSPAHDVETWERLIPKLVRLTGRDVALFAGHGQLITDNRPLPEYFLIRSMKHPAAWLNPAEVKAPSAE
jgi:spermidine synthase